MIVEYMSNSFSHGAGDYAFRDLSRGRPVGNMFLRMCSGDGQQAAKAGRSPARHESLLKCERCGHEWSSIVDDPKRCPSCGSFQWNKPRALYECRVCGHTWASRKDGVPNKCPKCKTSKWNEEPDAVRIPIPEFSCESLEGPCGLRTVSIQDVLKMSMETSLPVFSIMTEIRKNGGTIQV